MYVKIFIELKNVLVFERSPYSGRNVVSCSTLGFAQIVWSVLFPGTTKKSRTSKLICALAGGQISDVETLSVAVCQ